MKLEDQVVSLELSKKLKELGVKQESLFYWIISDEPYISFNMDSEYPRGVDKLPIISAFTVSELLKMLPALLNVYESYKLDNSLDIISIKKELCLMIMKNQNSYIIRYQDDFDNISSLTVCEEIEENNLSNSLAKMLIYLIENSLIKVEDLK